MTDHEFAIDFVARMIRFLRGVPVAPPIQKQWLELAASPYYADAVRMLEERLADIEFETLEWITGGGLSTRLNNIIQNRLDELNTRWKCSKRRAEHPERRPEP